MISKGKWTFFCLDLKGLLRGCCPATEHVRRWDPRHLWVAPVIPCPYCRTWNFSAIPDITSMDFGAGQLGCRGKDEHFILLVCSMGLRFYVAWREEAQKWKLAALGFGLGFLFSFLNVTNAAQAGRFRFCRLLFQVSLLIIMVKRHCNWEEDDSCLCIFSDPLSSRYFQTQAPVAVEVRGGWLML